MTTARHGLAGNSMGVGSQVWVNGWTGNIVSEDPVTDSCFIEVPGLHTIHVYELSAHNYPSPILVAIQTHGTLSVNATDR